MGITLWALDKLYGNTIAAQTRAHLAQVTNAQVNASRQRATALLQRLAAEPGPHVLLGQTEWGQSVKLPLEYLVQAHSAISGSTGSGKTMASLLIIDEILRASESSLSLGVLDAKGELFERTLYLLGRRLAQLSSAAAERLKQRVVIVDLSSRDPLASYNIASPWSGSDLDFFANSRVETLQDLLPSGDGFSLRGSSIVKHVLKLLAEHRLPFSYFHHTISDDFFRTSLADRSEDADTGSYFRHHFTNESRATIAAVRARVATTLFGSESLKLALSGQDAPDFRRLQDEGKIILINCSGPNISRTTSRTLQALLVSDIRQAVFSRRNHRSFLWICDEAQNLFRTRQLRENMSDLLTMSRSYGSFFLYLTQNLSTATQDGEVLETLHTNTRWNLCMRGSPRDAAFLQMALPITGRLEKPRRNPYAPAEFYSSSEERALLLSSMASLPDRYGWLWSKSLSGEAIKIKTAALELPQGDEFRDAVERIRSDASIGHRVSRETFLAEIARRNAELGTDSADGADPLDKLKTAYQEQEIAG